MAERWQLQRLLPPALRQSVWVHVESKDRFLLFRDAIQAVMDQRPNVGLVLTSQGDDTMAMLRQAFPNEVPLPLPLAALAAHWLRRLSVQHLIMLDATDSLSAPLQRAVHAAGIPVTVLEGGRNTGSSAATDAFFAQLNAVLPRGPALPPVAQDWKVPNWRDRFGSSRLWQAAARRLTRGRVDGWDALAASLGHPRRILCLGNGPSSEDPRATGFAQDCLFRVNWRWQQRGILTSPQVVFVGDADTIGKLDGVIFGLWNRALEQGMLLRHLRVHGLRPMRYVTMERSCAIIRDQHWPARPSNGALMIAAAAALQPDALCIAGIDLYQSPEGRYPGDPVGSNAYARTHRRETDLAIIGNALASYRGALTIVGDALRDHLRDHLHDLQRSETR